MLMKHPDIDSIIYRLLQEDRHYKIAEEDLALRGPGDFFGSRQSGLPAFRVASLSCDLATLKQAQEASANWIDREGTADTPEGMALRQRIAGLFQRAQGTMN